MESTGERSKIQISEATADILNLAGKNHWLRKREDAVEAKGKGLLTTYWLNPSARVESNSVSSDDTEASDDDDSEVNGSVPSGVADVMDLKKERLVDWMYRTRFAHSNHNALATSISSKRQHLPHPHIPHGPELADQITRSTEVRQLCD